MKYLYTALLCAVYHFAFSQHCAIHPPTNLKVINATACTLTLTWKDVPEASSFQVRYKVSGTQIWSPRITVGTDTFYVFTGLDADKKYDLSVRALCSDNTESPFIKKTGTTLTCSLPVSVTATASGAGSFTVSWINSCPSSSAFVRYKTLHGSWITLSAPGDGPLQLNGLQEDSGYLYQVSTCADTAGNWTTVNTFNFPATASPNIILIILDDSRFDFFSCNGAPSFLQTPNIDRIANEGVNFKNYFSTCSICVPSRACMATGLYPVKNGATNNDSHPSQLIPSVDKLLHSVGYYTAMLGKNHGTFLNEPGSYDFWMDSQNDDTAPIKQFKYNGTNIFVPGFITEILTDTAAALINRTNQPLFLWLAYRVPHEPVVPEPAYDGIFDNEEMPISSDTAKYTVNYPSFLYSLSKSRYIGGDELVDQYKVAYEAIAALDAALSRLFDALESSGKLDNTLLLFVSDNGHIYGEHGLNLKRLAYEPSLRIPLFARYPAWFNNTSVITDQIALNIDIAPTILEAAGIPDTIDMDGISLHKLYNGTASRTEMFYEYLYSTDAGFGNMPSVRGIRDLHYKYIRYGCTNDTTEEFFNLKKDPDEMVNLVNNAGYAQLIEQYRAKFEDYKILYGDTAAETKLPCYLKNPSVTKEASAADATPVMQVYPNPASGNFTLLVPGDEKFTIQIFNAFGNVVYANEGTEARNEVDAQNFGEGIYFIQYEDSRRHETLKLVLQHQ